MTVLEPGCGMGFFTLDIARLVGPRGRVIALDLQPKMLEGLRARVIKAGLFDRVETRLTQKHELGIRDLFEHIDIALAFYMIHELPDADSFFREIQQALKPGGKLLIAEPLFHVNDSDF